MAPENRIKERRDNYIELELKDGDVLSIAVNSEVVAKTVAPEIIIFRGYVKHKVQPVTFTDN